MSKHTYYRLILELASPLALGSGKNEITDHDCARRRNGQPYIPASSIAGVLRHYYDGNKSIQEKLYGTIEGKKRTSGIIFYDGELSGDYIFSVRDNIKLENKIGIDGAKFDMEIVETGAQFITYIEIDKNNSDNQQYVEELLTAMRNDMLRFGSKTTRGYGMIKIISLKKAEFSLDAQEEIDKWLRFDMFDEASWNIMPELNFVANSDDFYRIKLSLKQKGALSIRVYTTDIIEEKATSPDYKHITLGNGAPIIPGTSWAGAFRERYCAFAGKESSDALFGYVNEEDGSTQKSRIIFSESIIAGSTTKQLTRNSIDRFSAKTKDAALYTELTCYNGITSLEIIVPDNITDKEKMCLSAVIYDLGQGYLSVGGLTTVGHGLFSIQKVTVNETDKTEMFVPEKLMEIWR